MGNKDFASWVESIERVDLGYTYVRLYADAPNWIRLQAVNHFGKGTVFLRPRRQKPHAA